ncbi:hypothetical protein [Azospirillum brasilense]|uniref:hypothetical protein n=1 Tax=Azospirillum brasilense TaxID=192 RepID=UPI0011EBD7D7|nr:hypothetical protein [Azospirillum brasilense]QEL89683.1 hypothetical protein D9621_05760 [Azospirillum brasilense]
MTPPSSAFICASLRSRPLTVTVATPPTTDTLTPASPPATPSPLRVAVAPLVRATSMPPMLRTSVASTTPLTVNTTPRKLCPASTVEAATALNRLVDASTPTPKVLAPPVAVRVGTASTVIVAVALPVL